MKLKMGTRYNSLQPSRYKSYRRKYEQKKKMVKEKTPLDQIIEIQNLQFLLDKISKNIREQSKEKRSLKQKIPELIRKMKLQ